LIVNESAVGFLDSRTTPRGFYSSYASYRWLVESSGSPAFLLILLKDQYGPSALSNLCGGREKISQGGGQLLGGFVRRREGFIGREASGGRNQRIKTKKGRREHSASGGRKPIRGRESGEGVRHLAGMGRTGGLREGWAGKMDSGWRKVGR